MSTGALVSYIAASASAVLSPTDMLQTVLQHFWAGLLARPWLLTLLAAVVAFRVVQGARAVVHGVHPRDPVRRFSSADRAVILARAGHRCEHHSSLYGRCPNTDGLEADHVHPHSRGGWTAVENGQALCRRHNKTKSARVPWNWQLKRLARRRAVYFPLGAATAVSRHRPRGMRPDRRRPASRSQA